MVTFSDLKTYFREQGYSLIIAADGEPVVSRMSKDKIVSQIPAGGVGVALDPVARAANALYIARGKSQAEKEALGKDDKMLVGDISGNYDLKRLFFTEEETDNYYYGFSNQTIWPLCHVAFEQPQFNYVWYQGYKKVNTDFAKAIQDEIKKRKDTKTFVWVNDYQLALVPELLKESREGVGGKGAMIIALFWHIPWPTWEIFRILPYKKQILRSLLACDFLAFHRSYQVRNFLDTVERELEARIDQERQQIHFQDHITTVRHLPLGIDTDFMRSMIHPDEPDSALARAVKDALGLEEKKEHPLDWYFEKYKVIFGVDRLDYTKGIKQRLQALDRFFEKYPKMRGKAVYLGITAPSREPIPAYKRLKKEVKEMTAAINAKYASKDWRPIHMIHDLFTKEEVLNFCRKADLCLVTPLDDGMNLVSKEFVIAASTSPDPGMLVLSQFAGSAIDLGQSLIVNPYAIEEVADAIKQGLDMSREERSERIQKMASQLDEKNVYEWGMGFIKEAIEAGR